MYTLPLPPAAALLLIVTPVPVLPLPITILPLAPVVVLLFSNVMVAATVFVAAAVVIEAGDTLSSTNNCAPAAMTDMAPLVAVKLLMVIPVPPALVFRVWLKVTPVPLRFPSDVIVLRAVIFTTPVGFVC